MVRLHGAIDQMEWGEGYPAGRVGRRYDVADAGVPGSPSAAADSLLH